jgi:hypothetical protein
MMLVLMPLWAFLSMVAIVIGLYAFGLYQVTKTRRLERLLQPKRPKWDWADNVAEKLMGKVCKSATPPKSIIKAQPPAKLVAANVIYRHIPMERGFLLYGYMPEDIGMETMAHAEPPDEVKPTSAPNPTPITPSPEPPTSEPTTSEPTNPEPTILEAVMRVANPASEAE